MSRLASVSGDVDLSTDDGQFLARILGAVAKKESDDKSRRIRRKHEELAQAGKVAGGGTRPYGYEADKLTVRESEAVVIRECAARLLAGEALRSICADLDERGVADGDGCGLEAADAAAAVDVGADLGPARAPRRACRDRGVAGDHQPGRDNTDPWPARRIPIGARTRLPAATCSSGCCAAGCAARRSSRARRPGGARGYVCARGPGFSGCGRITVMADPLEQFVVEAVLYRLDSPELAAAMTGEPGDPDAERWQAEIDQSREQLDELAAMYGRREIGLSEWQAARTPIERRVSDAQEAARPADPHDSARRPGRQRLTAAGALADAAADPPARDRRRRPRPRRRRPRQTRLQPLRPRPLHARLARLGRVPPYRREPARRRQPPATRQHVAPQRHLHAVSPWVALRSGLRSAQARAAPPGFSPGDPAGRRPMPPLRLGREPDHRRAGRPCDRSRPDHHPPAVGRTGTGPAGILARPRTGGARARRSAPTSLARVLAEIAGRGRASSSAPEPTGRSPISLMCTCPRPQSSRISVRLM